MTESKRPDLFPIMSVNYRINDELPKLRAAGVQQLIIGIPWEMILPHEKQAQNNHGQTLRRLAERGGLGVCEAVAIIEDRKWRQMPGFSAHHQLARMVASFNAELKQAEVEAELRAT